MIMLYFWWVVSLVLCILFNENTFIIFVFGYMTALLYSAYMIGKL